MAVVMGRGAAQRLPTQLAWVEHDAPTQRVGASCRCARTLYFRYLLGPRGELVVEDAVLGGPAVLRCSGCGETFDRCPCAPSS